MTKARSIVTTRAARWLCGALLMLLAAPALAAGPEVISTDTGLSVDMAGHRVSMPQPVWTVPSDEPIEQAQTIYNRIDAGVESMVLIPMDATVVTWSRLMGVLVVNRPGYNAAKQLTSIVDPMGQVCAPNQLVASEIPATGTAVTSGILLLCGRYKPSAADVPKRCGGAIVLAAVAESPNGAAKVYYEWCTPTFDAGDRTQWPVPEAELIRDAATLMAATRLEPLPAVAE